MNSRSLLSTVLAGLALAAAGCGGSSDARDGGAGSGDNAKTKLSLVAYSTPQEAYEELIPRFRETDAGKNIGFTKSFGSSGDQARSVEAGLAADVVALSLEPDITKLIESGHVGEDWNADEYKGMVTNSVVVLAVRKGNPKDIRGWADLLEPGIEVVTPNPFTSGGARWNLMAAYGAQIKQGKTHAQALGFLSKLIKGHVKVQDKSARESLATFSGGKGDVLLAYENEAITAQKKGISLDYVIPDETILIENPIAVVTKSSKQKPAKDLLAFLRTPGAQRVFAEFGYRPVVEGVGGRQFPTPKQLFTIAELGGWKRVMDRFFDPEKGEIAKIEEAVGVSTG